MTPLAAIDVFAAIMFGGVGLLLAFLLLLGWLYPGTGADQLNWRPTRSPEVEAANEVDDVAQMLEAANERRRARGKPERTLDDVELEIATNRRAHREQHSGYLADLDIAQMLEAKNARRERKGLPALTREQYEAQLRAAD